MKKWTVYVGCWIVTIVCAIESWRFYFEGNILGVAFCEGLVVLFAILSVSIMIDIVANKEKRGN